MVKPAVTSLRILIHVAALAPLAVIAWDFAQDQLTANPIEEITHRTGRTALILLVLTLACTPINTLFSARWVLGLRRPLGLYAFLYATLHLLIFVGLDYGFDFPLIKEDLGGKRFVLAGLAAYLALLPLAVTSTGGWKRKLGRKWYRLHWLVYPAILVAVTHFFLQVKADYRVPALYAGIIITLLIMRLPGIRSALGIPRKLVELKLGKSSLPLEK